MAAALSSCNEKIDNSNYSDMLGENYNQELLWDPDSMAFRRANWQVKNLMLDANLYSSQIKMLGSTQSVSYIKYTSKSFYTKIGVPDNKLENTSTIAQNKKAIFAINGGLFNDSGSTTFVKTDGKTTTGSTTDASGLVNGAVAFRDTPDSNELLILSGSDASESSLGSDEYIYALATGPVLLIDGVEQEFPQTEQYMTRTARSIIGLDSEGNYIMAVIDGGIAGNADGATIAEAAYIARIIGMKQAVCLASGTASSLWCSSAGTVSHPSGNGVYDHGGESEVANIIYVEANTLFEDGDGTAENPYQIASARQIKNMSSVLVEGSEVYFELTSDIDMEGIDWIPLNYADPYMKKINFDGKGHTISNFTCSYEKYPSFFGVLHGECRNVAFINASISTTNNGCGIIAGYIGTTGKPGLLENCYINGNVTVNGGKQPAGGAAAYLNEGAVKNCYFNVSVTTPLPFTLVNLGFGGVAGELKNNCTVENCFVKGTVSGSLNYNAGGIIGRSSDGNNNKLINNIAWLDLVEGRVAAGSITGRWKTDSGTSENNYSKEGMTVTTYTNTGDGNTQGPYHGSDKDYSDFGIPASNATEAANILGWDTSVWDLTGELPTLKLFAENEN